MSLSPVSFLSVPYEDFPNFFLKFFEQGTTTPLQMATDSTGDTLLAKAEISGGGIVPIGFIKTVGNAIFIPFVDGAYDAWLFPTEAEADANDTTNATQIADDIDPLLSIQDAVINYNVLDSVVTDTNLTEGTAANVKERTTGNGGSAMWDAVLASGVTTNPFDIIQCTGAPALALVLRVDGVVNVDQLGPNGIDDSLAWQHGYDLVRDTGVKLEGTAGKTYTCLTVQTCLSNTITPFNYIIDYNGCTMDFSGSGLTSGDLIKIGATSTDNAHDKESIVVTNLDYIGPEGAISAAPTAPDGTTVGLSFENALNLTFGNITGRRCFEGVKTNFCFPLLATSVKIRECYVPFKIEDDSTLGTWIDCGSTDCRYSGLIQPTANTESITNQTFINFRSEGCEAGFYQDPLDGSGFGIDSIVFIEPYFENIDNVHISIGLAFTLSTPATIGDDRTRLVFNPSVDGGLWSKSGAWSATKVPLALSTTGTVLGGKFRIPCQISEVVGVLKKYTFQTMIDTFQGSGSDFEVASSSKGMVVFTGSSGSLNGKSGNIATVTRTGTGTYDVTTTEAYVFIVVSGVCDAGDISVTSTGESAFTVTTFDKSATPTLFDPTRVRINIDGTIT